MGGFAMIRFFAAAIIAVLLSSCATFDPMHMSLWDLANEKSQELRSAPASVSTFPDIEIAVIFSPSMPEEAKQSAFTQLNTKFPRIHRFDFQQAASYYLFVNVADATEYVRYSPQLWNVFREGYMSGKKVRYQAGTWLFDSYGQALLSLNNENTHRSEEKAWRAAFNEFHKQFDAAEPKFRPGAASRCLLCGYQELSAQRQAAVTEVARLGISERAAPAGIVLGSNTLRSLAGAFFLLEDYESMEHVLDTDAVVFDWGMNTGDGPTHLINEAIRRGMPEGLLDKLAAAYRKTDFLALDGSGMTPLTRATLEGDHELMARLIGLGADVNQPIPDLAHWAGTTSPAGLPVGPDGPENMPDTEGVVPLLIAVQAGDVGTVNFLLDNGARADWVWTQRGGDAASVALASGNVELAETILSAAFSGAPAPAFAGNVLVNAAANGATAVVSRLLAAGVPVDAVSLSGNTAVHGIVIGRKSVADARGLPEIAQSVLGQQEGAMTAEVLPGSPAAVAGIRPGEIITAIEGRRVASASEAASAISSAPPGSMIVVELVDLERKKRAAVVHLGDPPRLGVAIRDTSTISASLDGRQAALDNVLKMLVSANANLDAHDAQGLTPVALAVQLEDWSSVGQLVSAGADPGQALPDGRSLVHLAVENGDAELLDALIYAGADLGAVDSRGRTVLHYAYPQGSDELDEGHYRVIGTLIAAGVDPEQKDYAGLTAALEYQSERQRYFEEQERRRRAAEALRRDQEIIRRNEEERDRRNRAAQQARQAQERARKAESDAALHRALTQAAVSAGTAIGNAMAEQRQFEAGLAQQQAALAAAKAAEAAAIMQQQNAQQEAASANAAAEARQRQLQQQQAEARRQAELQRGRQRQEEIYRAVQAAEARKREAARAANPVYNNTPRVALNTPSPGPSGRSEPIVQSCDSWQEKAYAACTCAAKKPFIEDPKRHNLGAASRAFDMACGRIWVKHTPDFNRAPPLHCNTRGEFDEAMRKTLAEEGIGDYMVYAGKAWSMWQSNLGCSGR